MSKRKLDIIDLDNGKSMLVEVLDIELPEHIKEKFAKKSTLSDMPSGAESVGIIDDAKISMALLKDDLTGIADSIKDVLIEGGADEFSVELSVGFAGKGAIPFIVSAESNAGIKITATWKKGS